MSLLRHVDLCSGIGGFSLGFEWAELSTPILFCDTEPWCRKILAKNFPNVPIAKDSADDQSTFPLKNILCLVSKTLFKVLCALKSEGI